MSITTLPAGTILVDDYETLEDAIFDGTGFLTSDRIPNDLADAVHLFIESGENVAIVNPNHEEYVELIIRIPRI